MGEEEKKIRRVSTVSPRRVEFDFDFDKFLTIVQYMAERGVPELDKYKIVKLLFLADKYHLVRYGRPILGDRYHALEYGPIPSTSLDLLNAFIKIGQTADILSSRPDRNLERMQEVLELDRRFQHPRFSTKVGPTLASLSRSDIIALDHVIETFGSKNFNELKSITHSVYAYRNTWERERNGIMDYKDFFQEDPEAIEGALEEMLENDEIRRAFPTRVGV